MDPVSALFRQLASMPDPVGLLAGLFAHAPVGFQIYSTAGKSLLVNQAFRDLFGSEPPPEYCIFDDEIAAESGVLDLIHRAFAGETVTTPPIWYDARELKHVEVQEGRRVAFESTFFPLIGAAGAVTRVAIAFKDVTADMLRHAEAQRREVLGRLGAAFARELDRDRLVQLVTEEATRLVGASYGAFFYNREEAGRPAYALHAAAGLDREVFRDFPMPRATDLFGPTYRGEATVRLDDVRRDPRYGGSGGMPSGHPEVVSYLAVPVVARTGQVFGGLFFGHPEPARFTPEHEQVIEGLADHAAVAMENARLYGELRQSEERARQADQRKDEFLAMLSHELRNPLAPIATALELLKVRGDNVPSREWEIIERQVGHLIGLLDDLLDVSRITQSKIQLHREPIEISAIVSSAIEIVSPLLEQRRHTLEVDVAPGTLPVDADPRRLAQVVANLLHNAAKYTEPGGLVSVAAKGEGDEVVVRVRDTGSGMSPELVPVIFDMFVQAHHSIERAQGGLGLGLTLVKKLVELHGGRVSARSEGRGKGSEFEVRLPLAESRHKGWRAAPAQAKGPIDGGGRSVLVVDDNEDAAELLAHALRRAGFAVEVAYDGLSALDLAARIEPEVALLDIGLPLMDGYEVARQLRKKGLGDIELIAITGYGQDSDRARTRELGFAHHFVKPVDLSTLLESLRRERAPA